jgi:hypothetical protein
LPSVKAAQYCVLMTQNPWESASGIIAGHVQHLRKERGWSVARLAAECAKVGAPQLTANVLTNLLSRQQRRRDLTVEEVGALAAVFGMSPNKLLPEIWDPIDDPARLILSFKTAEQAEEMRKTLAGLEPIARAMRDELIAAGGGDG